VKQNYHQLYIPGPTAS